MSGAAGVVRIARRRARRRQPETVCQALLRIRLAPHRDEETLRAAGALVHACYPLGGRERWWIGNPEHRWRYGLAWFLDSKDGKITAAAQMARLEESFRIRLARPEIREAFFADVREAIAVGRVYLIFGDHEPKDARCALVAARVFAWAARKLGIARTETVDEVEGARMAAIIAPILERAEKAEKALSKRLAAIGPIRGRGLKNVHPRTAARGGRSVASNEREQAS